MSEITFYSLSVFMLVNSENFRKLVEMVLSKDFDLNINLLAGKFLYDEMGHIEQYN